MTISKINTLFEPFKKIDNIIKPEAKTGVDSTNGKSGFGDMLSNAIKDVDGLQNQANNQVKDLMLGKSANPHEAMISLEKADVAFQLMNAVRSRIIRAYEEVMKAQV